MVSELIPVLGSQPAGDRSHKPGGRLPTLGKLLRKFAQFGFDGLCKTPTIEGSGFMF